MNTEHYELITPPFSLRFSEMSKKEKRAYFEWFLSQIPLRIMVLERSVQATTEHADWKADYSPRSLISLGEWFAASVATRERSANEAEQIYASGPSWFRSVEVPSQELSDRTFSIAVDIAMYVGEVLRNNLPNVNWVAHLGVKRDIDAGQPVLQGFGHAPFNPVRMMVTLAYGLADGSKAGARLLEIYEIWCGFALRAATQ